MKVKDRSSTYEVANDEIAKIKYQVWLYDTDFTKSKSLVAECNTVEEAREAVHECAYDVTDQVDFISRMIDEFVTFHPEVERGSDEAVYGGVELEKAWIAEAESNLGFTLDNNHCTIIAMAYDADGKGLGTVDLDDAEAWNKERTK